jgi:DNA-directed RNA polymerase sigma subunit (sigma70/sigma32)
MNDLGKFLTDNVGEPIGPELLQALLMHLTPLERRVVDRIDTRPDAFQAIAAELRLSERRVRELHEQAIAWLLELANDALQN